MAWDPFSAEAIQLHGQVRRLDKDGRISEVIQVIVDALQKAHTDGPSNVTYEEFERRCDAT